MKHLLSQVSGETAFGHDVNLEPQLTLDVVLDGDQIKEAAARGHVHQQVDIAGWSSFPTSTRSEDPDVASAMGFSQTPY